MSSRSVEEEFQKAAYTLRHGPSCARPAAKRSAAKLYREAWKVRREDLREDVLLYILRYKPKDGGAVIFDALRSKSHRLNSEALVAAQTYARMGRVLPDGVRTAIERIAERDVSSEMRKFALGALIELRSPASTPCLSRIAADARSSDLRAEANLELLRRGDKQALAGLFKESSASAKALFFFPSALTVVEQRGLPLSARDQFRLERLASKAIAKQRALLWNDSADEKERSHAAIFLVAQASKRYRVDAQDVDVIGRLAVNGTTDYGKGVAVNALGRLGSARARKWIARMAEQKSEWPDTA